jgi:hypothetical protein
VVVGDQEFLSHEEGPKDYVYLSVAPNVKRGDRVTARSYVRVEEGEAGRAKVTKVRFQRPDDAELPFYDQARLPSLLFLGAGGLTFVILLVLWALLPDLFYRTYLWATARARLETAGLLRLPGRGPVVIATNAATPEERAHVASGVDRVTYFLDPGIDAEAAVRHGKLLLASGEVVATSDPELMRGLMSEAETLPVGQMAFERGGSRRAYVVGGSLLAAGSPVEMALEELSRLGERLRQQAITGGPLEKEEEH